MNLHTLWDKATQNIVYWQDSQRLWADLSRLLAAHGASGTVLLPNAIGDDLHAIVQSLGLEAHYLPKIGNTGNCGLWFGADKAQADLLIVTHLDRPAFRVRDASAGILYPMCAIRVPVGGYTCAGKALRWQAGGVQVAAQGRMIFERDERGQDRIRFEPQTGDLAWHDWLTMDATPTLDAAGVIMGTGLDNCLGVQTCLGVAQALASLQAELSQAGLRVLIVFSDEEEGIPEAYFGHGAARLTGAIPQPRFGTIIADAHTVVPEGNLALGAGVGHGTVSAWSRGSVVPMNYVGLARALSEQVHPNYPNMVQLNTGYLSRSDDMALGRWSRILGMIGAPMTDAHTAHERAHLSDLPAAMRWLTLYSLACLRLDADLVRDFALDRL